MAEPPPPLAAAPASKGPFACRLALKLTHEILGPVCEQAIACLINHGMQQYGELLKTSGLPAGQLSSAVLVLIQHNYVNCYLKEEPPTLRGPGPSYTLYEAALPRILQSLRVPRFMTHISDEHGQESVRLVRNLTEHGRLRWDQLLEAVVRESAEEGGEAAPAPGVLLNQFRSLVMQRYIERVPPCTLPPPPQHVHPNARKKKAPPKPGSEEEADMHREQADAALRHDYQQVRFRLPSELMSPSGDAVEVDAQAKPAGKRKRGGKDAAAASSEEPAKKRERKKAGEAGAEGGSAASLPAQAAAAGDEEAPVLWRVNYDEFNRRFRNDVIVSTAKLKYGVHAGQAVEGLLVANACFEQTAHCEETVVLSVGDVSGALRRIHSNEDPPDNLACVLSDLADDDMHFLESRGSGPGGEQYVLSISRVLRFARLYQLKGVIRTKFGVAGMRIWRLLLLNGQLEQKQVADLAMVTKEEAREALYAMLKGGYLALQDVPRTNDRAPSRTFYTWRANADTTIARLTSDLYRAAGNLHARLEHEARKQSELWELLELPVAPSIIERRQGEIAALKAVTSRLEAALLDLDWQVCIFADV